MLYNLFDTGERLCMTQDVRGTEVHARYPEELLLKTADRTLPQYFAINPLSLTRRDANVTAYRNILLEFDIDTKSNQEELVRKSNVPCTTITWSGNKSYHVIISLEEPCKTRGEYDALVDAIYSRFPTCDKSARNPSRLSRTPGAYRDNGEQQELWMQFGRVSRADLTAWLASRTPCTKPWRLTPATIKSNYKSSELYKILRGETMYFLAFGAEPGQWNRNLFLAALDLLRSGHTFDETLERLNEPTGYLDASDMRTIRSARDSLAREE